MSILERSHLEIILALKEQGSLIKAANKLNLTQSALTHAIKKLENQLGVVIWRREGRHLVTTDAGEYLLRTAERLIPQFQFAEEQLTKFLKGEKGCVRIGMECHPCYRWLLKIVAPYFDKWPNVEVDVKQRFQFGGIEALLRYEIDILVTPDPLHVKGLIFVPVFDYELVLVVGENHWLVKKGYVDPPDIKDEVLITYPVSLERLDIYTQFLLPANIIPSRRKVIETTDIIMQMVASHRGITALPKWLIEEQSDQFMLSQIRFGHRGILKKIYLGVRESEQNIKFIEDFIVTAKNYPKTCSN